MRSRSKVIPMICLPVLLGVAPARAALLLKSYAPIYAISTDGSVVAKVKMYVQDVSAVLSGEGGLNSFGIRVQTVGSPANPPTLTSIVGSSAFDLLSQNTSNAILYGQINDLAVGAPVVGGSVYLGEFQYTGFVGVTPSVQFQILDGTGEDWYSALGTESLDSSLTSGTFTVSVPEPASIGLIVVGVGLLGRRTQTVSR